MTYIRKPEWLKTKLQSGLQFVHVNNIVKEHGLHTICSSGRCPNMSECWNKGTATFMISGEICTRSCKFCNTLTGRPLPLDPTEPAKIAESIQLMNLKHAVVTSVDRDDLPDGGAYHWAETIKAIRKTNPDTTLEVLIPDFDGKTELLNIVIAQKPDIISHNLETVRRLTPSIRTKAKYDISLKVLSYIHSQGIIAKTGIMVGLGETEEEVLTLMDDALATGCSILTIGQYMQPSRKNIPVSEYITPAKFEEYKITGLQKGFRIVESAPLVRSSYCAEKHIL
ncbi:lipoic acid synthetase [Paludibacter propionicigenes WB4]|uniref:Lipoyl synthase n=1 Tax=Paludibacter propionicigenes (strain DSM 17365 / JCM 13257 / WB4) TaxID=694427 RepID=E4T1J3_PALPW|nr:lipoyl synthase [Paludibacter propionicigenes]ADQ78587.1 lipoic acid synthetase [Paludibacter propionicigenes WB4]